MIVSNNCTKLIVSLKLSLLINNVALAVLFFTFSVVRVPTRLVADRQLSACAVAF